MSERLLWMSPSGRDEQLALYHADDGFDVIGAALPYRFVRRRKGMPEYTMVYLTRAELDRLRRKLNDELALEPGHGQV